MSRLCWAFHSTAPKTTSSATPYTQGSGSLTWTTRPLMWKHGGNRVRVVVELPCKPTQITVDPDQVLMDSNPVNNSWKTCCRLRFTPFYTPLEETDVTNEYDRWNFIVGPGFTGSAYNDPWFQRAMVFGGRAGFYRTQEASAATSVPNRLSGHRRRVDALADHFPFSHAVQSWPQPDNNMATTTYHPWRLVRYISCMGQLYLPPAHYVEGYAAIGVISAQPDQFYRVNSINQQMMIGTYYHLDHLTL